MVDGGRIAQRFLERCLDGAQNQVFARPQIAREISLERAPNAARRQLCPRADGGADELRDGALDYVVGNRAVSGRAPGGRGHVGMRQQTDWQSV